MKTTLRVAVHGQPFAGGTISVDDLVALLRPLQSALERAALVLVGQQAARTGRRPRFVEEAARLQVVGLHPGSVVLQLQLDQAQANWVNVQLGQAAARAVVQGLVDLPTREVLPPGWDVGVASSLRELGLLFRRGAERIDLAMESDGETTSAQLVPEYLERVAAWLTRTTAGPYTVEGRLLMADFAEWRRRCRVYPPFGSPVECVFEEAMAPAILDALTRYVRVTGEAEPDPASGRIRQLRIADLEVLEAETLFPGHEHPFWEPLDLMETSARHGIRPLRGPEELRADIWQSERELEEFLAEVYAFRSQHPPE